jgi:hypothetical protein
MKHWLLLALFAALPAWAQKTGSTTVNTYATASGSCPVTVGTLTLSATVPRSLGISPFLVFYDATATTDSGVSDTVLQSVTFTWNFGDSGPSGTGTWAYGSNPNVNSMNVATGINVAHLYRTQGYDQTYNATVTATDGTNTASCVLGITAQDPGGVFSGTNTICFSTSGTFTGCPSGATHTTSSSTATALAALGNGKRILFRCGETFTGDSGGSDNVSAITKYAVGAYGGCQDTTTNRPIVQNSGGNVIFQLADSTGNGTWSDLDCEGAGPVGNTAGCFNANDGNNNVMYQTTWYNLKSNNQGQFILWDQCSQCGIVQGYSPITTGPSGNFGINTYVNVAGWTNSPWTGNVNPFSNIQYAAIIGSHFDDGATQGAANAETVRVFACQNCYIANSDFLNAGVSYAVLKYHAECNEHNTSNSWCGFYSQYAEISDNLFGGLAGGNGIEICSQNSSDERHRYISFVRNMTNLANQNQGGRQLLMCGQQSVFKDNIFNVPFQSGATNYSAWNMQFGNRGSVGGGQIANNITVYNNTFYAGSTINPQPQAAIELDSAGEGSGSASNMTVRNNLQYYPSGGGAPLVQGNTGSGNTVSNNTSTSTSNPSFTNGGGSFLLMSDFKPTTNYSGAASLTTVIYDGNTSGANPYGVTWSPTWDLGAIHH